MVEAVAFSWKREHVHALVPALSATFLSTKFDSNVEVDMARFAQSHQTQYYTYGPQDQRTTPHTRL